MKPSVTTAIFQTNGPRQQLESGQFELRVGTVRVDEAYQNTSLVLTDRSTLRANSPIDIKVMSVYARRDNTHTYGIYALLRANSAAVTAELMDTDFGIVGEVVGVVNTDVAASDLANIRVEFQVDEIVLTEVPVVDADDNVDAN